MWAAGAGGGDRLGHARGQLRREADGRPRAAARPGRRRARPRALVVVVPLQPRRDVDGGGDHALPGAPAPGADVGGNGGGDGLEPGVRRRPPHDRCGRGCGRSERSPARWPRRSDGGRRGRPGRPAQQRQVDALQRVGRRRGGRRPAHVLDGRDGAGPRRRPRSPARGAGRGRRARSRASSCRRRCRCSTSPGSSAAHRTARGSATSSSAASATPTRSSTSCAASTTTRSPTPPAAIDPLEDAETVELELIFADLAAIERRAERVGKAAKGGEATAVAERAALDALREWLEEGRPARSCPVELAGRRSTCSRRSRSLYVANVDESRRARPGCGRSSASPHERGSECIAVNAKIEAELRELPPEDAEAFLADLGIERPALDLVTLGRLPPARPHPLLHHRAEGDAGVDDPPRPERAAGGRPDPHRPRARVHPGRGDRVGPAGRGRARRPRPSDAGGCGSRAATTSSPTATR